LIKTKNASGKAKISDANIAQSLMNKDLGKNNFCCKTDGNWPT